MFSNNSYADGNETFYNLSITVSLNDSCGINNESSENFKLLMKIKDKYSGYESEKFDKNETVIIFYLLIATISLIGNLLVCFAILKNKAMRTKTNILMANITMSGLMMTIFNIPFVIARILLDNWPFGLVLCKLLPSMQITFVYVSTFTMAVIAIDRYQAINSRFYRRISNVLPISMTITIIWIISFAFSIPELVFNELAEFKLLSLIRCRAVYPEPQSIFRQLMTLAIFLTQYIMPLMITTIAYVRIGFQIRRKYILRENDIQKRIKRSDQKIIKMLSVVVVVFAICWLPLNCFHIYADFSPEVIKYDSLLFYSCHMLAMSYACYNPFIYFGLNKHFRYEMKNLFRLVFTNHFCKCFVHKENTHRIVISSDANNKSFNMNLLNSGANQTQSTSL